MTDGVGDREREKFWTQLLGIVAKGSVVPVIGEDLLHVPYAGVESLTIYEALAMRYSESCGIVLPPEAQRNLSMVVTNHEEFFRNPHDVYSGVGEEYAAWEPPIPEPLRALARIRHLNLFVSTTFDNLLERALNEERFGGKALTEVINYSPKRVPDRHQMEAQLSNNDRPVIFQMFGNCRDPLRYALTEGDKVEYMHALQTRDYCPERIFEELYDRPLLLLGNRFPDWLTRIFLRMIRKTPLNDRDVPKQYVSDAWGFDEGPIRFFLNNFATNTKLIEEPVPVALVTELSRRWAERFGNSDVPRVAVLKGAPRPMPRNAIFLSYCATDVTGRPSPDEDRAVALRDALESLGMDVWFDKDQLQGGDDFERRIQRYINTCSLFVPLISHTTESRDEGFFRREWSWAILKLAEFTGADRQFIFPIVLDSLDPYKAKVPDDFKRFQFTRMDEATPDSQIINRIQWLYQRAHQEL